MARRRNIALDRLEGPAKHIAIATILTPAQWVALRTLARTGSFPWIAKRPKSTERVLARLELTMVVDGRPTMTQTGRGVLGYGPAGTSP